jgi:hypothetical protein
MWGASITATEYPVAYTTTRNLLTDSQDFERGTWTKTRLRPVANNVTIAPDGQSTADYIEQAAGQTNAGSIYKSASLLGQFTVSVYAKAAEKNFLYLSVQTTAAFFDLSTGSVGTLLGSPAGVASITNVGNGWYRCIFSSSLSGTYNVAFFPTDADNSGTVTDSGGIYLWGAQLEPGSTATDYVRTVDVVGKAYRWFEPTEGTVWVEADATAGFSTQASIAGFFLSTTSTTSRFIELSFRPNGDGGVLYSTTGGVSNAMLPMNTQYSGKIVGAVKLDNANSAFDGTLATLDTSVGIPTTIGAFLIGSYPSSLFYLNGHIRRLTYWPRRLADNILQFITS